jgi:saccharopine dehydrogenase-like NADP-dependent oxidoreductase
VKRIVILGAGKSATVLIDFLLAEAKERGWKIGVGDLDPELAKKKLNGHPCGEAFAFDVHDASSRRERISGADLVISMVPAFLHPRSPRTASPSGSTSSARATSGTRCAGSRRPLSAPA